MPKTQTLEVKTVKYFIYATPCVDALNGIFMFYGLPVVVGQILRALIAVWLFGALFRLNAKLAFGELIVLLSLFVKDYVACEDYLGDLLLSMSIDFRYWYVLLFFSVLSIVYMRDWIKRDELLLWGRNAVLLFALIIIVTQIFDIGLDYEGAKKGFFIEVNALTALLVWGIFAWGKAAWFDTPSTFKMKVGFFLVLYAMGTQATKTGLAGAIVAILFLLLCWMFRSRKIQSVLLVVIMINIAVFVIYYYLTETAGADVLERWQWFYDRMDVVTFLLSGRNVAATHAFQAWIQSPGFILFGTSYSVGNKMTFYSAPSVSYGGPEMDIFDIAFFYGILFCSVVLYFLLPPLIRALKHSVQFHQTDCILSFGYVVFFAVMFLGGHVLGSPMSGPFFALAYVIERYPDAVRHE